MAAERDIDAAQALLWATLQEVAFRIVRLELALQTAAPGALEAADMEATRRVIRMFGLVRLDDVGPDGLEGNSET